MENKSTKVTVVIPVFNQEQFIRNAIESVFKQTYRDYSILVVDDGSTDTTPKILRSYSQVIDVFRQNHAGTSTAWNNAIEASQSKYLIGLDSDDEFVPNTISSVMAKALTVPNAAMVYSDYEFINTDGATTKQVFNPEPYDPIAQLIKLHDHLGQPDNFLPFGHVRLYSKDAIINIGGYDSSYIYAEDFDLVLGTYLAAFNFIKNSL